jgi:CTP synthase (UTP-ammonia lyase)
VTPALTAIGIVGEHDPTNETHVATDAALRHAGDALGVDVTATWVPTADAARGGAGLDRFAGMVIAPGGPYREPAGARRAIGHARDADVPLLGTCAGFQHLVIEFARSVLGEDARHAEYEPGAPGSGLFVTPLACAVAGQTLEVDVRPGTRAAAAYGATTATERYYCRFGLNPDRRDELVARGLCVSGTDATGETRIVELPGLRFFVATLFVPQVTSTPGRPHPLVSAFVAAAARVNIGA